MTRIRKVLFHAGRAGERMGPSGGRPALCRRERPAQAVGSRGRRLHGTRDLGGNRTTGRRDVDPPRALLPRRAARSLQARRLHAVPRRDRRATVFPAGRWLCLAAAGRGRQSACDRATSWCATTSVSGSRPRCCRPCASRRQTSAISPTSGTNGRRYRFTPTQAKVLRFLHDAALRGSPWQSGKAVLAASRLALAQARRSLQASAGVAGPGRGRRLRDSIAWRSR